MIKRIEWTLKMALGWLCFWPVALWPQPWPENNRLFNWLLSWAGFFAFDNGFEHYEQPNDKNTPNPW